MAKLTSRLNQIYQKIDSIAKKGKDGYLAYNEYLDELLSLGEWSLLDEVMIRKYQINTQLYKSVDEVKAKTFDKVRFNTLTQFQQDLKDLYIFYGVYQNVFDILLSSDNTLLGQIREIEQVVDPLPYYKDTELAIKEKDIIISLEVTKNGVTYTIDDNTSLIDKYRVAVLDLVTPVLILTFDNITNADILVGDSTNVSDWNTFFDLPTLGSPFASVSVVGNQVNLIGGSDIKVKPGLMFDDVDSPTTFLISIIDTGCVTSIGGDAFSQCYSLTTISFSKCDTLYGHQDSPYGYWGCFGDCPNLVDVNLPSVIDVIGDECFTNCSNLVNVNMPKLERLTGSCLFCDCISLTSVSLPSLVETGISLFAGCTSLTSVSLPILTDVGDDTFYYCSSLTSISLPNVTIIGDNSFRTCTSLTSVSLPSLITGGIACFGNCDSLTSISLPSLVEGTDFFISCPSLSSISLPSLTTATGAFFSNCPSLTSISLPNVTTIGDYCFDSCTSLTSISLPSCTDLGSTVGDDNLFLNISSNTISLTVLSSLMTCNSGNPDGDIQYLQANNTVTVTTV